MPYLCDLQRRIRDGSVVRKILECLSVAQVRVQHHQVGVPIANLLQRLWGAVCLQHVVAFFSQPRPKQPLDATAGRDGAVMLEILPGRPDPSRYSCGVPVAKADTCGFGTEGITLPKGSG